MPVLHDTGLQRVTADDFLDGIFTEMCRLLPERPPFEILQDYKLITNAPKDICITGLVEDDYVYVMDLYDTCKTYHKLPLSGGVEEQNPKIMQIFKVLEAESIRFEKIRMESKEKKS